MSERADGYPVDSGFRHFSNVFQGDSARCFRRCASVDDLDRSGHVGYGHVVQHHDVCPGLHRLPYLIECLRLDLDLPLAEQGVPHCAHERSDAHLPHGSGGDVVVFDERAVGEVSAMVHAASDGDRVFLQNPMAGKRLPGVENGDIEVCDLLDEPMSGRRDSAHVL